MTRLDSSDAHTGRQADPPPSGMERLTLALRMDQVAAALGVSRSTIERARAAGRFPPPDLRIGRMPLWRPETVRRWTEGGGRR